MAESNYEVMKRQMQSHFLEYDQKTMIRRFGLMYDADFLYIRFVGREYRIDRQSGLVEWLDEHAHEADYNEAMSIYDVLCCSKENCGLSGEFVSVGNLPGVIVGQRTGSGMFDSAAQFFSGRTEVLRQACERLGGRAAGKADAAFELDVFDFLPVRLTFWDGDEDFPPYLALLWDRNLQDFIHFETSFFIAGHLYSRLKAIMQEIDPTIP